MLTNSFPPSDLIDENAGPIGFTFLSPYSLYKAHNAKRSAGIILFGKWMVFSLPASLSPMIPQFGIALEAVIWAFRRSSEPLFVIGRLFTHGANCAK